MSRHNIEREKVALLKIMSNFTTLQLKQSFYKKTQLVLKNNNVLKIMYIFIKMKIISYISIVCKYKAKIIL